MFSKELILTGQNRLIASKIQCKYVTIMSRLIFFSKLIFDMNVEEKGLKRDQRKLFKAKTVRNKAQKHLLSYRD